MKAKGIVVVMAPRMAGIGAVAAKCGVTSVHLRYVMKGERKASVRLRRALWKIGVTHRLDGEAI